MSASRDQSQKFTFVYSNLYHLYKKGNAAAKAAVVPESSTIAIPKRPEALERAGIETSKILKSLDLKQGNVTVKVESHEPPRLMGKRLQPHRSLHVQQPARAEAIEGLKDNLKTLQGLHERLRFMLKELEELVQEPKRS